MKRVENHVVVVGPPSASADKIAVTSSSSDGVRRLDSSNIIALAPINLNYSIPSGESD